jgi:hypothetical protein
MTQYASFDHTVSDPKPVKGWYDTGALTYPSLPASADLLELTSEQWAARLTGQWAVSGGALVPYTPPVVPVPLSQRALAALTDSDTTMHRITEAVALGLNTWTGADVVAWITYRRALRAIANGGDMTSTTLPTRPAYPAGT